MTDSPQIQSSSCTPSLTRTRKQPKTTQDFIATYDLPVVAIPTALPNARRDYPDAIFRSKEGKLRAMLRETRRAHKTGQPILVGTTSVETSELIADALQELNISCKVRDV